MYEDQPCATGMTKRESIVDELHAAATQIESDLETLESQLIPVLRSSSPRPIADEIQTDPGSQVRHALHRFITAAQRVRDIRDRLEV